MKVLLFCPTRPKWPHLYGRMIQSVFRLLWDKPLDYLFMRGVPKGSRGKGPFENAQDRILWKYQRGREAFLRGDYDAMLTVEADIIVPPDALRRLSQVEADVAYGLYIWRRGQPKWSAYGVVEEKSGMSLSELPMPEVAWDKVVDVAGVGFGCTLIHRHVLEAIEFRRVKSTNDWYFALDCQEKGFEQKCDLGVVCGHISAEPSPRVLWPDPDAEHLFRIEFLGGRWMPMEEEKLEVVIEKTGTKIVPLPKKKPKEAPENKALEGSSENKQEVKDGELQ